MITKTTTALVAALILGSASTSFAADVTASADRVQSSYYQQSGAPYARQTAPGPYARAPLYEGRNVGVQNEFGNGQYPLNSDQKHWYERAPIDFNS